MNKAPRAMIAACMACALAACTGSPQTSSYAASTGKSGGKSGSKARPATARMLSQKEINAYAPAWVGKLNVRPSTRPNLPTIDLLRGEDIAVVQRVFGAPLRTMNAGQTGLWVYRADQCTMHLFVKDAVVSEVILRPLDQHPISEDDLNRCFRSYMAAKIEKR